MNNPTIFSTSIHRSNISLEVRFKSALPNFTHDMIKFIQSVPNECGIIYCNKRRDCSELAKEIRKIGIKVDAYHAGLQDETRRNLLEKWMKDEINILVATIAFGMGIDVSNL